MNEMGNNSTDVLVRAVKASTVPKKGVRMTITLDERERAAITAAYDLLVVLVFDADIHLEKRSTRKFHLAGTLTAKVHQPCVVTLAPVETVISEPISVLLVPEADLAKYAEVPTDDGAIDISLDDDLPDGFTGDEINVGRFVLEFFALGLNPYPQAPGAALEAGADDGELRQRPFASLAALKDKMKPN